LLRQLKWRSYTPGKKADFLYYLDYWYVFFVKTGKELEALKDFKRTVPKSDAEPFIPYVERFFKKEKERRFMFPSYLFAETSLQGEDFIPIAQEVTRQSPNIIRLLTYDNKDRAALRDEERQAIQSLWKDDEKGITASEGIIEGDKVIITEGSLVGMETVIRKIDRHKRTAEVEVDFLGRKHRVSVGLEVAKKVLISC
jgi:transcriptional antiterminator NusG